MELVQTLLLYAASLAAAVMLFVGSLLSTYFPPQQVISIAPENMSTSIEVLPSASSTASTTPATKPKSATGSAKPVAAAPIKVTTPPPPLPTTQVDPTLLNSQTRETLVNILCMTKSGTVHPISGSGIFIDTRGVILTNAHVGQFFLLKDYPTAGNVDCVVRTGSPARPLYHATLLYLPPAWVNKNGSQIASSQAKGTGEDDYSFLLITERTDAGTSLPSSFPALPMTSQEPRLGESTLLVAYPAGFLDGLTIEKNLYITSAYAIVKELFTFGTDSDVDLVSIGGTIVSQGGSSGGATVRASDGKLLGIIATATAANTTAERDLRTITMAHINRSLAAYGKGGVATLLSGDLAAKAADFNASVAPSERAVLIKAIEGK